MKREFGTNNIGFFVPIITIEDSTFIYKGKVYSLKDIITINKSDDIVSDFFRNPSTSILLNDGIIFRLPVTLEEKNIKQKHKFLEYGYSKSSAYKDIINIFENSINCNSSKYSKYIYSLNYIMFYRWLIIIGILTGLFIIFALYYGNIKMNPQLALLCIMQLSCLGIGLYMLVKRRNDESLVAKKLKSTINAS